MGFSPVSFANSLRIGAVDFVSPDEIKVLLDIEAPDELALNTGEPIQFPRVNSYVLMPVDDGFLVGQITWVTIERSAYPKRSGMHDFGLIDLPFPLRKLSLNPLGTLRQRGVEQGAFVFQRGSDALPSVGTPVLLPTARQLRSIVESGARRRVKIGTAPLAGNAEVMVDPDRLFGRHLAVLGNTGSGKSCSVAGLIRWSLATATNACGVSPNARFVILDPNGEYARAFGADAPVHGAKILKVAPIIEQGELPLQVPLWFWNSEEWCSFTNASSKTQRPTLTQGLRSVKSGDVEAPASASHDMRRYLRTLVLAIRIEKNTGSPWSNFPRPKAFFEKLETWRKSLEADLAKFNGDEYRDLKALIDGIETLCVPRRVPYATMDFTKQEVETLFEKASLAHSTFGGSIDDTEALDVDAPIPFRGDSLLRSVEATAEILGVSEYAETLLIRIRALLSDSRMKSVIEGETSIDLLAWLRRYVGDQGNESGDTSVVIIDLSLVPSEVVHVITAVVARMILEALQRYRKKHLASLPTVLVMEEAHTFVKRYRDDSDETDSAGLCCRVFERIAREGRKFGLGLILSSQRPSELSPTVLSQCNTYLLHRISNDRDQDLVNRLVPDSLRGLLRELPSLPSQNAILLGWATELPVLVRMNDLPKEQQPRSDDPDFWDVWTGKDDEGNVVERPAKWEEVVADWQGSSAQPPEENANGA